MDREVTIYIFFFLVHQQFLPVLLPFCVCDSWQSIRTEKTVPDGTMGNFLARTGVLPRNTSERLSLSNDAPVTLKTLRTDEKITGNSVKGLNREAEEAVFRTSRVFSPRISPTDPTSNLTVRSDAPVKLELHQIPDITKIEDNARTLPTRPKAAIFRGGGVILLGQQIGNVSADALAVRVDGEVSGSVHNTTVKIFVSESDNSFLKAGIKVPKRRQDPDEDPTEGGGGFHKQMADVEAANRFTTVSTTTKIIKRTTPPREVFEEQCDYIAHYCLRVYQTGRICGRTIYHNYTTFKNYCMLDYVNCMERYEMWQLVHMGQCYTLKTITEYIHYGYHEDQFLDEDYVPDDQQWGLIG